MRTKREYNEEDYNQIGLIFSKRKKGLVGCD